MTKFQINIFLSQIGRLPLQENQKLVEKHLSDLKKLPLVDVNQIFQYVEEKSRLVSKWEKTKGVVDILTFKMIATKKIELSAYVFEEIANINNLSPTIQVELANILTENEKINLLNNFCNKLSPLVIQNFILALSHENQKRMIIKLKDRILQTDCKILLSFIGALQPNNQRFFLKAIKDYILNLDAESISSIITGIYDENLKFFFMEYRNCIEAFDEASFSDFFVLLTEESLILCFKLFASKVRLISPDLLIYKMALSTQNMGIIYEFLKANANMLMELSNTYFYLLISRLDDTFRLKSLTDFKAKYHEMSLDELLDLFEYDTEEIKLKLFMEYPDKINELKGWDFVAFVHHNFSSTTIRNKIFLLYKSKIWDLSDEDFIRFIYGYSEIELRWLRWGSTPNEDITNEELIDYIITNFIGRLKMIATEYLPELFSNSNVCLQHKYIEALSDNIKQLIQERTYLYKLLRSILGNIREELYINYAESFRELTAKEWYDLSGAIQVTDFNVIGQFLLECDIDNFDFINFNNLLNDQIIKKMFSYFEKNIQNKLYTKYLEIDSNNKYEELKKEYVNLIAKVQNEDVQNVLIDYNWFKLLVLLKVLFLEHIITDKDPFYQQIKDMYMAKLLGNLAKENHDNAALVKDSLFYRLVKGSIDSTSLIFLKTLKGLIFFSKNKVDVNDHEDITVYAPYEIEPFVENLTEEQVCSLNNRLFKQLCQKIMDNYQEENPEKSSVRNLAIRLYLAVGFQNAKKLIDLKVPFTRYEYIFRRINIQKIKLGASGEPIINKKLMDFMFGSSLDVNTNINRLLQDRIPEFEKRFADIYNSWETIYQNLNGNITVTRILKLLKENKILLNPDEYRLASVINEIGTDDRDLSKARELYSDMRKRKFSTIPKIADNYDADYSYEMLDLDDPLGLVVGYITRCCFLIDGASETSLFHSAQSKDGRIFVVRKNGELIAQSWVWRNGNLVCFDNVEARGYFDKHRLLEIYQKAAQNILAISAKEEGTKERIKLVTFGGGYSKIAKPKEMVPEEKIQGPRVNDYIYTDALDEQFILATNGERELYYGDVKAEYQDSRKTPNKYSNLSLLEREEKASINARIKSIDFAKTGNIRTIDFRNYAYAIIADDWYILITYTGEAECMLLEHDNRARMELYKEIDNLDKTFTEMKEYADSKIVKGKVLSLVKGEVK